MTTTKTSDTAFMVADVDWNIRTGDRVRLLNARNKLRHRLEELEGRLRTADEKYSYTTDGLPWDQEFDRMPRQHIPLYLDLLAEYEQAFDAMTRADSAL